MFSQTTKNKLQYYFLGYFRFFIPHFLYKWKLKKLLKRYQHEKLYIQNRVDYYNKISKSQKLGKEKIKIKNFIKNRKKYQTTYFLDTFEIIKFFKEDFFISVTFGDIDIYLDNISIVKSRPIYGDNSNSVLLKLNKIRHFFYVKHDKKFIEKKNQLVGRMDAHQPQRVRFLEKFINHPMCNVGNVNFNRVSPNLFKEKLSIKQHLDYKFISCIEGRDVASNLKWVMSSNSIAVMPKPKFETWFMEGTLQPNHHYIEVKDDFSDLEEKLNFYIKNPNEAQKIIENAHRYIEQFKDVQREKLIGVLVLQKFLGKTI